MAIETTEEIVNYFLENYDKKIIGDISPVDHMSVNKAATKICEGFIKHPNGDFITEENRVMELVTDFIVQTREILDNPMLFWARLSHKSGSDPYQIEIAGRQYRIDPSA
jgi:hypothetical protein